MVTVVGKPAPPAPKGVRQTRPASRECGPCRECCRLPDIPELNKPINTLCRHCDEEAAEKPCRIYDHRPGVCREFDCAWKQGLCGEQDRPDILGVMFQIVTMPDGKPGLGVVEARDGALDSPRVTALLAEFQARKPGRIIIRRAAEPRFSPASVLVEGKPLDSSTRGDAVPQPRTGQARRPA